MRTVFFATALALSHPLYAADSNGSFAIKGAGLQTCDALATAWDEQTPDLKLYIGWADGYLTGMNQYLTGTFDATPWQTSTTLIGLTRELCRRAEGSALVMKVFNDLVRDFLPARLREESPASAITRGQSAMVLYADTVARVQRRLAGQGFNPGEANGIFDDQTAEALAKFQENKGLEATGLPDQPTLFALFVETPQ